MGSTCCCCCSESEVSLADVTATGLVVWGGHLERASALPLKDPVLYTITIKVGFLHCQCPTAEKPFHLLG